MLVPADVEGVYTLVPADLEWCARRQYGVQQCVCSTSNCFAQGVKLECRNIEGKRAWTTDKIFDNGGPVLWAPAQVWEALQQQDLLKSGSGLDSVRVSEAERGSISWVFVPTFNRYHAKPDKQILLDWADAMPQNHPYIRFVVIRPLPAEEQVRGPAISIHVDILSMLASYVMHQTNSSLYTWLVHFVASQSVATGIMATVRHSVLMDVSKIACGNCMLHAIYSA